MLPQCSTIYFCAICGAENARNHYGGIVCSCCRVFFLRQARRLKLIACKQKRNCYISPGAKNNCQACRYLKCLSIGMKPREVGRYTVRDATVIGQLRNKDLRLSFVFGTMCNEGRFLQDRIKHYFSSGFKFVEALNTSSSVLVFARKLIKMEAEILKSNNAFPAEMYANVDSSLADVLLNSQICCPRDVPFLSNWKEEQQEYNTVRYSHCRAIVKYVDFVTALPDIHRIHGADKLKLIQENFTSAQFMTVLYRMWNKTADAMIEERMANYQLPEEQQEIISRLTARLGPIGKEFCGLFERLNLQHEELILLKVIHVFSAGVGYSETGCSDIQEIRTKYLIHLGTLIQELFPCMSESEILERVTRSLEILMLAKIANQVTLFGFRELFAVNADKLAGNLTYDLYIREY